MKNEELDPDWADLPLEKKLPILEIQLGSFGRPASEVLKELGYANPEELRRLREEEDKCN
jgi:hypothetical protein